jgi:soluble lytic murein transglycosylase-like protein
MAAASRSALLRLAGLAVAAAAFLTLASPSQPNSVVITRFREVPEPPAPVMPSRTHPPLTVEVAYHRYARMVEEASRRHGVDRALVHALIMAESSYNPEAVSAVGATGLMQLMPDTAREHGVSDPFDPANNIQGGVKHLKSLLVQFDGDEELAIAAYNAGSGAVIRAGNRIPGNPETTAFVPRVIEYQQRFRERSARSSVAAIPSPGTR